LDIHERNCEQPQLGTCTADVVTNLFNDDRSGFDDRRVSDTFSVTTAPLDITPDPFTFADQVNVALNALITSNTITVSGISGAAPLAITGGAYEMNGNGIWATASGTVVNGNTVRVRQTSSPSYGTRTDTTLTIGGASDTFSVTTFVPDTAPNPFIFIDQTNITRARW